MKAITTILSVALILLITSEVRAQTRTSSKENGKITLQDIRNDIRAHLSSSSLKYKSGLDRGLAEMHYDSYINDWENTERDEYAYSVDRSMITIDHYNIYNQEQTFQYSYSTEITLNDQGLVENLYAEFIPEVYTNYDFFYDSNGNIDSLFAEDYEEGFSFITEIRFNEITSDSMEFEITYRDSEGGFETEVNYSVMRDGNYIEYYIYTDWIDRYTYYNFNISDFGSLLFDNMFLLEEYNDEFYPDEGWIPYSRDYFVEEEGVVTKLVAEYFDSGVWYSDGAIDIAYDAEGRIIELTDYFMSGEQVIYNERYRFIYGQETSIDDFDNTVPGQITLHQNYPNPFNPSTNISYELANTSDVELKVYNMLGKEVATLIDGRQTSGSHTISFDASNLPSGLYIYRLLADGLYVSKSMMLIK